MGLVRHRGLTSVRVVAPQSDFFDDKHLIVLGSSYASPRRLARPSMLNWYQANCESPFSARRFECEPALTSPHTLNQTLTCSAVRGSPTTSSHTERGLAATVRVTRATRAIKIL